MNATRIALSALGAFVVCFALGGLLFAAFPPMRNEFMKYPAVYRSQESMKSVMPEGMAAMLVALVVLAVLLRHGLSRRCPARSKGPDLGTDRLVCGLCVCYPHHVNLNIGLTLTIEQAIAHFVEWVITGLVIGRHLQTGTVSCRR